ncbi:hypothetical protein OOT46_15900 [Aquabacterium sp. A7-Y]|uniref:hypothetical protein n=1 Tax=Aquabacterium sp. A7-Y TaxID=1349605 RepID=UPI00223DF3AE|nr:hypothetical protein [Aquabacterium sp. A7-Y]MCW7539328.1 hypothetical protein [Aquabacterium sp. A7-Y]
MTRPLFGGGKLAPSPPDAAASPAAGPAPVTPAAPVPAPAGVRTFHGEPRRAVAAPEAAPAVRTFHGMQSQAPATPAVRTFEAEQHHQAVPPRALFAPSISAELPAAFLDALAQLPGAPTELQHQRTTFRLLKDLDTARDEDILQFGEGPAAAVDGLLKQAMRIMTDPDLPRVGALLKQTLDDLASVRPQARSGWLQRLTRSPVTWLASLDQTLEARLKELAAMEQAVLDDAGRLVELIERNEDQLRSLAQHHWACRLAEHLLADRPPATRERLARRAQLLSTLSASADMTRRQLQIAREHLLTVAERVQTLRFATLPLWRQQFLAPLQSHKELAVGDSKALDTHQQLMDQLGHLVTLTSRKVYD